MRRTFAFTLILFTTSFVIPGHAQENGPTPHLGGNGATNESDFDGDGYSDLAVGVPGEDLGSTGSAGVIQILYGSAAGLVADDNDLWSQDTENNGAMQGVGEEDDSFGTAVAAGDINNDGFSDLVVGAPGEDVGTTISAGAVHVIYGSKDGLTAEGNDLLTQDGELGGTPIKGSGDDQDRFGADLVTGDFGKSRADDLAIAVTSDDVNGKAGAGIVQVFYGSNSGLTAAGQQLWHHDSQQNGVKVKGKSSPNDSFGDALATGDFGKSGKDDLAIGASSDNVSGADDAGTVTILYGTAKGLKAKGNQLWHQDSQGAKDSAETENYFGSSLSAANFGRSSQDDLAVGVLGERTAGLDFAGAVNVFYGSGSGLTGSNSQFFHQNSEAGAANIADTAEADDSFGESVQGANFGSGNRDDLAVGANGESVGGVNRAGVVHVLYGTADGLTITGNLLLHQDIVEVEDSAEDSDIFGSRTGAGDFDANGQSELSVGVYREEVGGVSGAGAVQVFYGSPGGLDPTQDQFWSQSTPEIQGGAEENDGFGVSVNKP